MLWCDFPIITKGDGRRKLFLDQGHYERFTKGLEEEVLRSGWIVLTYCWMQNHIHALIQTPQPNLATKSRITNLAENRNNDRNSPRPQHSTQSPTLAAARPKGNWSRQLLFAPELNVALLENAARPDGQPREQQIWTYRFGDVNAQQMAGVSSRSTNKKSQTRPQLVDDVIVSVVDAKKTVVRWQPLANTDIAGFEVQRAAGHQLYSRSHRRPKRCFLKKMAQNATFDGKRILKRESKGIASTELKVDTRSLKSPD